MKSARRRSREFALQALYQWQMAEPTWNDLKKQYSVADSFDKADAELFESIVKGVIKHGEELGEQLGPHLDRPWAEVSPIERGILWIGAFELDAMPETPYRVIINESIELAKTFGGTDGHKYVNGVLDKFAAVRRADELQAPAPKAPARAAKKAPTVKVKAKRSTVK